MFCKLFSEQKDSGSAFFVARKYCLNLFALTIIPHSIFAGIIVSENGFDDALLQENERSLLCELLSVLCRQMTGIAPEHLRKVSYRGKA